MKKSDIEEMRRVVDAMCKTAEGNGLPSGYYDMERVASRLHRIEARLARLAERECSDPSYGEKDEAAQERLEALAAQIVKDATGAECRHNRDPRGYCIRMVLPVYHNSWDGETTALAW